MATLKPSKPKASKPAAAPEKATYKNVYGAAIGPLPGVKLAKGETIVLTEAEAAVCGEMLERV